MNNPYQTFCCSNGYLLGSGILPCHELRYTILSGLDLKSRNPTRLQATQGQFEHSRCLPLRSCSCGDHLQTVDDHPLRAELAALQRRLARKIEVCLRSTLFPSTTELGTNTSKLVSPILESIEFRYTRGNSALEAVVRVARELREEIDLLVGRYEDATIFGEQSTQSHKTCSAEERRVELLSILAETKQLMTTIDDLLPSINLWVSAIGGIQAEQSTFSPSRLLQASMLVNVGDTQFVLNPSRPMQIGPDFTLSLYMLFRGHATAQNGEAYGLEEGQRKPMWQEVIHKARVRLYRTAADHLNSGNLDANTHTRPATGYAYQLQIVEDLDDGRVHTFENGNLEPGPYDGISLAGIREIIPIGQISKMFYADVGRILNINNEDGASGNPVLLLKRDTSAIAQDTLATDKSFNYQEDEQSTQLMGMLKKQDSISQITSAEPSPQDDIDRQLREESQAAEMTRPESEEIAKEPECKTSHSPWSIPQNLDLEWIALEVFDIDDSASSDEEDHDSVPEEEPAAQPLKSSTSQPNARTLVDSNLLNQLQRMSLATEAEAPLRPSSARSRVSDQEAVLSASTELVRQPRFSDRAPLSPTTIERSPFGAIKTSLSILEMLLRLTSLQEFEQATHLSIPDHVLRFYLDDSAAESGLYGEERWAARAEAAKKMGFDPYVDTPDRSG
jgi:hypothetical protein